MTKSSRDSEDGDDAIPAEDTSEVRWHVKYDSGVWLTLPGYEALSGAPACMEACRWLPRGLHFRK